MPGQEVVDFATDHRRAAQAATDQYAKADFACFVLDHVQANVVHTNGGAIFSGAVDGDLEFVR